MRKQSTINEYIKTLPQDVQSILQKIRKTIKKAAPKSVEAISYQIPAFKLNGKNLVHFAAWKNHIGFYPGSYCIKVFKKELLSYKKAKGSIQFPIDKPIPYGLIKKIVKYRIKENLKKIKRGR